MSTKTSLQDYKINVKLKLAALWTGVLFCYVYGDFFTLFIPGHTEQLNSGSGASSPAVLLMYAVMMSIPPLLIFLSLFLTPKINRILNLMFGSFFTLMMILIVATTSGKWMLFYIYLGLVEIILTLVIVWLSWKWPREFNPLKD